MICSTCHSELLSDAAFCNRCGASIRRYRRGVRYAGFWRRVLAVVIDLVLLAPAIELGKEYLFLSSYRWERRLIGQPAAPPSPAERQENNMTMLMTMSQLGALVFVLCGPYYVLTESSTLQGTLGKRILGLKVTDLDGRRIRPGRATLRYLSRMISATPWCFGFVMAAFTSKKRALHDFLAGTLVVIADKAEETEDHARDASA